MTELCDLGVVEAAAAIRSGRVSSEQLTRALLAQADAKADLNAFVSVDAEPLVAAARAADRELASGRRVGPLHGVPIALKDNINAVGLPTTAGTPALQAHYPRGNAAVAQRLFDAGALLFGKAGMHELALGATSNNGRFGAIGNPHDPLRSPGGSSGGSGAAVAARIVPASIGTDTGGSVRIPAALCGAVGYRPTVKRWPQAGIVPISGTRDTPGPIARSVADVILLDAVVTGELQPLEVRTLSGVRLGIPRSYFWQDLESETARLCNAALETLRRAGVVLVEADLPDVGALDAAIGFTIALYELPRTLDAYLESETLDIRFADLVREAGSPDVAAILKRIADGTGAITGEAYAVAMSQGRPQLINVYADYFDTQRVDAVVFPTTPLPAPRIGDDNELLLNGRNAPTFATLVRNTGPGSNAGVPGVSLPIGRTSGGLPVGLGMDGRGGGDRDLLAIALAMEPLFREVRVG